MCLYVGVLAENPGQACADVEHILFLVNLCPWPGPMKPPCCMCIHFLSTHIDNCLLFFPRRCPAPNAHLWLWCARAGVQFKDSSGTWRRNGDRLFNKLCLVIVWEILKERTLITPKCNTKMVANVAFYSNCEGWHACTMLSFKVE